MVVTKLVTVVCLGLTEKSLRVRVPPTIILLFKGYLLIIVIILTTISNVIRIVILVLVIINECICKIVLTNIFYLFLYDKL